MLAFPLRCPSCHHDNPVEANFCNNCGMPVNLEACGHCDAINRRGAERCHKCGSVLRPSREPAPDLSDVAIDSRGADFSDGAADTRRPDETLVARLGPFVQEDLAAISMHRAQESHEAAVARRRSPGIAAETSTARPGQFVQEDFPAPAMPFAQESREAAVARPPSLEITEETSTARPGHYVREDFPALAMGSAPESQHEVVARRRRPGMRPTLMGVMLVALAVPGYIAYQDPAQFREGFDAITSRLDAPSEVPPTPSPQPPDAGPPQDGRPVGGTTPQAYTAENAMPAADSASPQAVSGAGPPFGGTAPASVGQTMLADITASPQRESALMLLPPHAAATTRESASQLSHTANETQSLAPQAAGSNKAPQTGKNVRQTQSSATSSKQGKSSRKVVKPKASDSRTRSSGVRRAESTAKTEGLDIQP